VFGVGRLLADSSYSILLSECLLLTLEASLPISGPSHGAVQ